MADVVIKISAHAALCLGFYEVDIAAVLNSQIEGRVAAAQRDILVKMVEAGKPLTGDPVVDVAAAYQAGVVKTAQDAQDELAAALTPAVTPQQLVSDELIRRKLLISGTDTFEAHLAASAAGLKAATSINTLINLGQDVSQGQRDLLGRLLQASQDEGLIEAKAAALMALPELPDDYTDDAHWQA